MVFRKYKPAKQWGKMDTRIFKQILLAKNKRKMPSFLIPEAVKELGVTVHNPNKPGFFTGDVVQQEKRNIHNIFSAPPIEEHPLYNKTRCYLFDGTEAMSDGMAQACVLSKAILKLGLPESIIHSHGHLDVTEQQIRDAILHGEKYDPTLEKLPRKFDPVMFWLKHPRVHGTPVIKKNNIILNNLYRAVFLSGLHSGKVTNPTRCDRDEPISGFLPPLEEFKNAPFVLRFQPHLTIQDEKPVTPWATSTEVEALSDESITDIYPISPLIDLGSDHIYNKDSVIARAKSSHNLHTIMWTREQNQKYPWTTEQNAANAILHTFGAAVAEATRNPSRDLRKNPVVVKGVQLINGKLDFIAFQLNTLNLSAKNSIKNVVWVEKSLPLYKSLPYYEQMTEVQDLNMETVHKFVALVLNR